MFQTIYTWSIYLLPLVSAMLVFLPGLTKRIRWAQNLALSIFVTYFSLLCLELILRAGLFDSNYGWAPSWAQEANTALNKANYERAALNPYGFIDAHTNPEKAPGTFRLAVLGDSFVWGDGVTPDIRWSAKLADQVAKVSPQTEVLHWGACGWSTKTEFEFLKAHAKEWKIDLLVVGFVSNDPDFNTSLPVFMTWQSSERAAPFRTMFPEAFNFVSSLVNNAIYDNSKDIGYSNWQVTKLYSDENLTEYGKLLKEIAAFTRENNIKVVFALTPTNQRPYFKDRHAAIVPRLQAAGLDYIDLYPAVVEQTKQYTENQVRANRANSHPGTILTSIFANEVFQYLTSHSLLPVQ